MEFILATFLRQHHHHDAWWYKLKISPLILSSSAKDAILPADEAPGQHCLSKLLGITMNDLWKVLAECNLTRKKGQKEIIVQQKIQDFINMHDLTNFVAVETKGKEPVLRVGVYLPTSSKIDHSATSQWRSDKRPPRPLRNAAKKFRDDTTTFLAARKYEAEQKSGKEKSSSDSAAAQQKNNSPGAADSCSPPAPEEEVQHHQNLKDLLSKIIASPSMLEDPSFFKNDLSEKDLQLIFEATCIETCCELERRQEMVKKQKAVSDAVEVKCFEEVVDVKTFPTLVSKGICLTSDIDVTPVLRDLVKLSKTVKSVDLLKVLHFNGATTSLVEIPCSTKMSGFKKQARRSQWVLRILQCVRRFKKEDLLVNDDDATDPDDEETAFTDDDAARWLLTYLGECFPSEFVKSAQALDMPIHQGKMDAEYTTAMWSDAGVGVGAQRIIMKYFTGFFGYKFTVPETSINQLASESVPPVVGTVEYLDHTLDYWYKDLEVLLTRQIAREHTNQPGFFYTSVDFVIGADHGQGSFRAGVKVIYRNADQSIYATAIYGLGEIECAKDTGDLLALAFIPRLNMALRRIIQYERGNDGNLLSDGTLTIYKKAAEETSRFYAILDRTNRVRIDDTLELSVPIQVFVTGDLAFYATVLGKEGMDKAHCIWCKLKRSEWQTPQHAPGVKWNLEELKRVAAGLNASNKTSENGVKSYPQLDCIELERYIFPVLHVTLGLANRLLKDTIDYADLVAERTPQVLKDTRQQQIEAEHNHDRCKQDISDWGIQNGPTLANMLLAQAHLDEQIQVGEGEHMEQEQAILDAASLKEEVQSFKKELSILKTRKTELSRTNTAAKVEVTEVEKVVGKYRKPIRKGIETILAKEWNIKRPSWHGGDILGNECRKLMSWARLIFDQIKEFLLEKLEEDGGSQRTKREVTKRCDIVAKALLLFDGFLSILRTPHQDLTPAHIAKAREYSRKALTVWRILQLSVTPKAHGGEDHACDQLEFLKGLADYCEDWVEQLHQLGLKNNRRTKTIRDRNRKYQLYAKWEQLSGNRNVQKVKEEVQKKRKRNIKTTRGLDTEAALQIEKKLYREHALQEDNSQWTGENRLLSPEEIIRLDAEDRLEED
jgi:hypothetical protein